MIGRIVDALLGRRCTACGERVRDAHRAGHWLVNHVSLPGGRP